MSKVEPQCSLQVEGSAVAQGKRHRVMDHPVVGIADPGDE